MYEAKDIAKNVLYVDKNDRELIRYQLYVAIQSNSKNKIDLKDVMSLPWDDNWLNKTEFEYDEKEDKQLNQQAQAFADMLNKGNMEFGKAKLM